LRPVTTPTAVADVAAVTTDAHQAYNGFPSDLFEVLFARPATVLSADMHAVVAYDNGGPVATAEVFMHDRLAYVGWVAVVRAATGRGLGWLVTEEVVTEALRRGAAAAVLMGSPMGAPLYRKMGFVDVGKLTNAYAPAVR
jgi:GNAT superfamily N-acetyltransferase